MTGFKKREADTNLIACMQHMRRQMFAAIKCRTFRGGGLCLFRDVYDGAHLSSALPPSVEYTEQAGINQEMQMKPADSLHN